MKGFVLAAGFGRRLSPLTDTVPKPLLPVGHVPLIGFALRLLAHHGITDVIVNLHHLRKLIRETLGDGAAYGVNITYSEEEEILGTGGGVRRMREQLADGPFVLINSDTIIGIDLKALIDHHLAEGALATLALREDERQQEFGLIEVDRAGRIRRILGQGKSGGKVRALMFTGVHVIDPKLFDYIPPDVNSCIMRYGYTKALHNDERLCGVVMGDYWNDAGTPERYLQANIDALGQKMQLKHVDPLGGYALEPRRAVADVVRMGEHVDLGDGVDIRPPVLLGDETRVADRAVVGPFCVAGPKVSIGKEARVAHAVLLEGAKVDAEAQLQRVIVGKKAQINVDEAKSGSDAEPPRVGP